MYLDDYNLSATIDFKFTTRKSTGLPTQLAGSPAVSVYKTNSTTQTTTGVTLTIDFDSVTGLNHVRIDTSADGTFYAAGCDFAVVITAGTVDSISVVGETVATFSILNRSALRPTTAGRTLDVSAAGNAGIDWSNIEAPTTTVAFTGTTIADTQKVDLNTIKTQAVVCAAGVTMGVYVGQGTAALAVDGSGHVTVGTMAANTLTASALAADAVTEIQSGLSTLTAAQVNTEVDTALADINLDHLVKVAVDTNFATTVHLDSVIGQLADNGTTATFDRTTDSQEAIRDRGDSAWITAAGFSTHSAADVWSVGTRTITGGTITTYTGNTPQTGDSYAIVNSGTYGNAAIKTAADLIVADTNELQTDWANGGRLDLILDATSTQTSVNTANAVLTKLDTTWALNAGSYRFTAAALALGPSGSTSVTINPYTATVSGGAVSDSGKLTAYQHADFGPFTITVVDADGDPVALNASDLVFVAFDPDGDGTSALFRITGASGDITVGGAGSNVVTIHQDDTNTSTAMEFAWVLRDTSDDSVVARGNRPISKIEVAADVA